MSGERRRVLVTGAAGRIGSCFAQHSHDRYDLRLMVQEGDAGREQLRDLGEVVIGDLTDLDRIKILCADVDTVVHLAADPDPSATWQSLMPTNIVGTYHVFTAARSRGCRRVVFASSIHAVSGYPPDVQVKTGDPVNPGDLYGVTKCFGEALARYMAEQEGLSVLAIRIGAFQPLDAVRTESGVALLDAFVSHRDLAHLIQRCIEVEDVSFAILHGVSDNRFKRLDISDTRRLVGYEPLDDAVREIPQLREAGLSEPAPSHNRGDESEQSGLREEL